jgi:hypothetical protein
LIDRFERAAAGEPTGRVAVRRGRDWQVPDHPAAA